jgi:hypothetical protein
MRSLASITLTLVVVAVVGCGGASKRENSIYQAVSKAASAGGVSAHSAASTGAQSGQFLNDGDNEREGDADGDNNADNDNDPSLDYLPLDYRLGEDSHYHDADDKGITLYGHAASMAVRRKITALVKQYYGAAVAGDGRGACAMLVKSLAKAVPVDYGEDGPSYLRSGKTCAAVMALLFEHLHAQLAAPNGVTGVRIAGQQAYALLGSTALPPSYIIMQRESGAWRIAQLLGSENGLP